MLMKGSLLLIVTIILLLNCMKYECRKIQCYSCSDCGNSSISNMNIIITTNDNDQCMKTTILTSQNVREEKLINRGASSQCRPYSNERISIICCGLDFCNA